MKIGDSEYSEIIVTDADDNLLVSITDQNIIEEKVARLCVYRLKISRGCFGWKHQD